ncbi:adenylyl-sulfate kinase [Fictibacillus nanhaiensis]|uniref:adenylyl-sulfate kinase n=1 Tax=Fictibacillus nanhaiensis TaxID=742169 RepID=UPI00204243FF|nr:adenylyl-sulfate kinase [Fictibacillus nanhaiensis]MCM3732381.1 adenylyl-sulfate kinase [Fictibacillus nanhaiensis]
MDHNQKNIKWQSVGVTKEMRQKLHGHKSFVLWFTGLSGSGKSTIASEVEHLLYDRGLSTVLLDGDNVRHGLCQDLLFSEEDRKENIRRLGEVAKLFVESGVIVLVAAISPIEEDRQAVRKKLGLNEFIEVYVDCSLSECENRDPKGLYKKVRDGLITDFTGISNPYEIPAYSEIVLQTEKKNAAECTNEVLEYLILNGYIH